MDHYLLTCFGIIYEDLCILYDVYTISHEIMKKYQFNNSIPHLSIEQLSKV